jgi:hypothetical protein
MAPACVAGAVSAAEPPTFPRATPSSIGLAADGLRARFKTERSNSSRL